MLSSRLSPKEEPSNEMWTKGILGDITVYESYELLLRPTYYFCSSFDGKKMETQESEGHAELTEFFR